MCNERSILKKAIAIFSMVLFGSCLFIVKKNRSKKFKLSGDYDLVLVYTSSIALFLESQNKEVTINKELVMVDGLCIKEIQTKSSKNASFFDDYEKLLNKDLQELKNLKNHINKMIVVLVLNKDEQVFWEKNGFYTQIYQDDIFAE